MLKAKRLFFSLFSDVYNKAGLGMVWANFDFLWSGPSWAPSYIAFGYKNFTFIKHI